MSNFAPEDFRPFVSNEEGLDTPIRVGAYATTPYWNGLLTAANNFNHLLAFSRKPVICQHGSAALVYTSPTAITFAKYVIKIPSLMNRRVLRVEVTGTTTGGTTFTPSATITGATESGTGAGTATASGSTCTFDVSCPKTDDFQLLTLSFTMSASATFTVTSVLAYSAPLAISGGGADLGTIAASLTQVSGGVAYSGQSLYTPQATTGTVQYAADLPLTVAMMSDMTVGLQGMFRDNVSPFVNWSYWYDHVAGATGLSESNVGLTLNNATNVRSPIAIAQYIYWPRQGVRKLKVFAAARVNTTPSDPVVAGKLSVDWRGVTNYDAVSVTTRTTNFTYGNWEIWGGDIDVPAVNGPCYLEIRAKGSSDPAAINIQSFAAFENSAEDL